MTAASAENATQLATQSAAVHLHGVMQTELHLHRVMALQEDTIGSAVPAGGIGSAGGVLWLELNAGPESSTGILQHKQHGC